MDTGAPFWKTIGRSWLELVFYFPFLVAAAVYFVPEPSILWWVFTLPLIYIGSGVWRPSQMAARNISRYTMSLLLAFVHSFAVIMAGGAASLNPVKLVPLVLLGAFFADRGYLQKQGWEGSFHSVHMFVGIMGYIVLLPLKVLLLEKLLDYELMLNAGGVAAILLFFIMINERLVWKETIDKRSTPALRSSRKQNRALMGILLGIMIGFLAFGEVRQWLEEKLRALLRALFSRNSSEQAPLPEQTAQPSEWPEWMSEPKDNVFMEVLERIIVVAASIAAVVAGVFALYFLIKKSKGLLQAIWDKLLFKRDIEEIGEESYRDETEKLQKSNLRLRKRSGKEDSLQREMKWEQLQSNGERIRYLYRLLLRENVRSGYKHKEHLTPRETAGQWATSVPFGETDRDKLDSFVSLYEDTRYGGKEPANQELDEQKAWVDSRRSKR
ncbi:DUF4129 domain-containing protein [Paenibacillus sp. GCM10027627]|uniref:DUF4129 domain-containing protein n=1 Tax=unclassified Paenibacillus TaxID=185978 RepID=UPI00362D90F0